MFPVTRQVRRKRTPVFGRPGRTRGARMRARRAEETAHRGRARGRSRSEAGLGQKLGGRGEREALEGESSVGLGRSKGLGESQGGLGERAGWRARGDREVPDKQTHRWPPDGQAAHTGLCRFPGRTPGPPGNQRCDPAGPAAVAECQGRSAGTPFLRGVRITRELRRARN